MTSPVAYWHVHDIEAKLAEVTAAGATVKEPAHDVGGGRLVATFTDPDGNVLGLLQDQSARPGGREPHRRGGHVADGHDLIRVHGARENNLKDAQREIPKRRLTVFTGVSGSGKSSLVFATIAAESQRLVNETYSAFVQGSCRPGSARSRCARGVDYGHRCRPGAHGRQLPLHRGHRHRRQRPAAHPVQPARPAPYRAAQRLFLQRTYGPSERCDHGRTRCR